MISLDQVTAAARDATALDSGGFVDKPNQRLAVRHRGTVRGPDDLARTVVAFRDNAPVRLGDVADVRYGSPPPIGDAVIVARPKAGEPPAEGTPGLLLIVEKQPQANTLDVTRKLEAALKDLEPGLTGVDVDAGIFRPATFVERAVGNLAHALLVGCGLVAAHPPRLPVRLAAAVHQPGHRRHQPGRHPAVARRRRGGAHRLRA